jgi:hypothetical protein
MSKVPVFYRQALVGERLRHYGTWAKYVPLPVLQRVSSLLPAKPLWQELIPCGDKQVELLVVADAKHRQRVSSAVAEKASAATVYSRNLPAALHRQDRFAGRLLSLCLLRRILPDLARQLRLFGDRLAVALAVADWERSLWILGLEPYARSITVLLEPREGAKAIGYSGVAVRQSSYASGRVDAHMLVYSPTHQEKVRRLSLRQDTLLVCSDGLTSDPFNGCLYLDTDLTTELGLPEVIWAERQDRYPVLETALTAAYTPARTRTLPNHLFRRLNSMEQALSWSAWPSSYRLATEGNIQLRGEI